MVKKPGSSSVNTRPLGCATARAEFDVPKSIAQKVTASEGKNARDSSRALAGRSFCRSVVLVVQQLPRQSGTCQVERAQPVVQRPGEMRRAPECEQPDRARP